MATQQSPISMKNETINEVQKAVVNFTCNIADSFLGKYPFFHDTLRIMEAATGLKKRYLIIVLASCPFIIIASLFFAPFILTVAANLYPIYMSVKTIEQDPDERTRWLIYWFLFNILNLIETVFGFILAFIPGYFIIKSFFLAWCMAPCVNNGCVISYYILQPFLTKPVQYADVYFNDAAFMLQNAINENEGLAAAATLTANIAVTNNNTAANQTKMKKIE